MNGSKCDRTGYNCNIFNIVKTYEVKGSRFLHTDKLLDWLGIRN
jgi:hypothetical protein